MVAGPGAQQHDTIAYAGGCASGSDAATVSISRLREIETVAERDNGKDDFAAVSRNERMEGIGNNKKTEEI